MTARQRLRRLASVRHVRVQHCSRRPLPYAAATAAAVAAAVADGAALFTLVFEDVQCV